jgi:hypothetical protein
MTKKEVQNKVSKNGKKLPLNKFNWDEKTKTFSSIEDGLVLDFKSINGITFKTGDNCTFKTGDNCTFKTGSSCTFDTGSRCTFNTGSRCTFNTIFSCTFDTGFSCTFDTGSRCTFDTGSRCTFNTDSDCTFNTGSDCTFKTGSDCTFKTGSDCTFKTTSDCSFNTGEKCVIIRRDEYQIIQPLENEIIKLCPNYIEGYISKRENEDGFYMDINGERIEHIIADRILSKVISKRNGIYKVINHGENEETYIIERDGVYSHGETLKEAKESLLYKLSDRDTSKYDNFKLTDEVSFEEAIQMYMCITGACSSGTKYFVDNILKDKKDKYTIQEIINLTEGQYNSNRFKEFFN